ncbi:DNA-3-methyladenine glycosylase [Paenibacillus sp. CC-CFT747]|nr:DNA-3-methyladenine glycosylase [Paenibacillus sp. CC-CFT747]
MEKLGKDFVERDVVEVARDLLGCYLVRRVGREEIVVQLTETEAYRGGDDPASHAHRGMTPRNSLMFGEPGRLYVYLIYGMHSCMNVVTNEAGMPGAVLLRAARPVSGLEAIRSLRPGVPDKTLMNGPGKLCQALGVTRELNGYDLLADPLQEMTLWRGEPLPYRCTERIGISKGKDLLWRFLAEA